MHVPFTSRHKSTAVKLPRKNILNSVTIYQGYKKYTIINYVKETGVKSMTYTGMKDTGLVWREVIGHP